MSTEVSWEPLSLRERRILGVLAEKGQTTPESYPLSVNALVTGSNQKSNRDPITSFDDAEVEQALEALEPKGLVQRVQGGRVDRWRHMLYEKWGVNKAELAVLTELLLRGPQTVGDLRGRASRMEPIASLDALREALKPLVERKLVVWLTPESRRGATLTHGFHAPEELEHLRAHPAKASSEETAPAAPVRSSAPAIADDTRLTHALAEIERLRGTLEEVQIEVARLAARVNELQSGHSGHAGP
jgi:uncharacterized protein